MAAPTETYVDPSIAADSGAGTSGDPYGDLQYALDQTTRDTTDGDRFNIKAGTDEVLTAAIDLTTYGTTATAAAPLIFQGYTSTAGDGGIGGISGNGSYAVFYSLTADYVSFVDLHCHNCGSNSVISSDLYLAVVNCEINNTTGNGISLRNNSLVLNCHIHDCGVCVAQSLSNARIVGCYLEDFTSYAWSVGGTSFIERCIVVADLAANHGCYLWANKSMQTVLNCSFLNTTAGTAAGINSNGTGTVANYIRGCLIEGWSGTGGVGIKSVSPHHFDQSFNGVYNCTTAYTDGDVYISQEDNESLSASPFAKSGSLTYANRLEYFAPVDTGNVIGGMPNGQDKGAVQSAASGSTLNMLATRRNMMIGR